MPGTLALLHTSHLLIPLFSDLCKRTMPGVTVFHMVDESLIRNTVEAGSLSKATVRRMLAMIQSAHEGGADAVMVTCSSIGAGVRVAQEVFDFPVLRVDDAMAEEAVRLGSTIGVLATLRTTLEPTVNLLRETAAAQARDIKIVRRLCDGAFDAVISGDNETHDDIVLAELARLTEQVEVVVLAQASMARVVACIPPEARKIPILSSPEFAVRHARAVLCPSGQAA